MGSVLWYWKLDLKFVRAVNDWEIEGIANLLKVLWKGVKEETFLVNEGLCLQLVSGSLMSQLKLPFFLGRRCGVRISPWISCKEGDGISQICVYRVAAKKR